MSYMLIKILAVFIGGGLGAVSRFLITFLCRSLFALPFLGTLLVNLVGCFFIGYTSGLLLNKINITSHTLKLFITVGLLGGLTTFSTFNFELFELIKNGKFTLGILYFVVSCAGGLALTFFGYYLSVK